MMLSTANLLSPAAGEPVVAPTQDMVLGCFYLTIEREETQGKAALARFSDETEALLAYDVGRDRHAPGRRAREPLRAASRAALADRGHGPALGRGQGRVGR